MQDIQLSFDIYITNPFDLQYSDDFILTPEQDRLIAFTRNRTHFIPKEWGSKHYIREFLREQDVRAAEISIAVAKDLILNFLVSELPENSEFTVEKLELMELEFGCVKLKIWTTIKASAVVVALMAGCSTMYVNHVEKRSQPVHVSCTSYVKSKENIGGHLKIIVEQSPQTLFDLGNSACTKLKQKALQKAGVYNGKIDGKFGDKTADAERNFAELRGIRATETDKIYESLADFLLSG